MLSRRVALANLVLSWIPISRAYAQAPADHFVLDTSTILDGKGAILKGPRIVVNGSRIESVAAGSGPATYDLRGLTVMPGWIDTHVHLDWHFDETHHITNRNQGKPRIASALLRRERVGNFAGRVYDRPVCRSSHRCSASRPD